MNVRHLTFRLLQVFTTVVRTGSVSEEARQLHLTQPTVSQQLRRLTEAVGESLLQNSQGRLMPTEAGRELYRASREVLGRFDDFQDYLTALRGGKRGRFSISLVSTAQYVLPRLLGPFSQSFPEVDVTLHIGNRRQVLTRFEHQDEGLYVFSHPPSLDQALAGRFLRNPLVVVAPHTHRFAGREQVAMHELLDERFLLREPGSATRMLFESWLQEHGLSLGPTLQMASNEAIRVGVAAGLGLAVLSEHVLPPEHPDLAILPVRDFPVESYWQFIVRLDQRLSHAALGFLRFAAGHLGECVEPRFLANELHAMLGTLEKPVDEV